MKESKKTVKLSANELSLGFNLHIKINPDTVEVIIQTILLYALQILMAIKWWFDHQ